MRSQVETIYGRSKRIFGAKQQVIIAVEELAELQKELTKVLRDKGSMSNLTEEIADVEIMLAQIKAVFYTRTDVIDIVKIKKLERLEKLLDETERRMKENDNNHPMVL